jgi:hypothetical protein
MGAGVRIKLKPPCWVKHIETGAVLRLRSVSRPNARMKREAGWKGLVGHVQNEKGTGIVEYRKLTAPSPEELEQFNAAVKKRFGL